MKIESESNEILPAEPAPQLQPTFTCKAKFARQATR